MDLIIRPSGLVKGKPWALQLRSHESVGPTEYHTICHLTEQDARAVVACGEPFFLFGHPDDVGTTTVREEK